MSQLTQFVRSVFTISVAEKRENLITFIHVHNKRTTNECRSVRCSACIRFAHASLAIKVKSNDLQQNASI